MDKKIVVITGGNAGIGYATVEQLALGQHEVIVACRDEQKAKKAIQQISEKIPNANLIYRPLDLASFDSVKGFAKSLTNDYPKIDVLINNAGAYPNKQAFTDEGFEFQFGVNYLGHFLLTHLLLPNLEKSEDPRIIHVSSIMHVLGKIDFSSFKGRKRYSATSAYAQSKLANLMFSNELSNRLNGSITSNAVHPGGVDSEIYRDFPKWIYAMLKPFLITPERAGRLIKDMSDKPNWKARNGEFVVAHGPKYVAPKSRNESVSSRLYKESCQLCGIEGV